MELFAVGIAAIWVEPFVLLGRRSGLVSDCLENIKTVCAHVEFLEPIITPETNLDAA